MKRKEAAAKTHITVLLDRTGSMEGIRDDTIGGFNAFLAGQKSQPGDATMTLVQFDSQDPYEVLHRFAPLGKVGELSRETYVPRASTPLLDAMGRSINDLQASLASMPEKERPGKVMMVVVTDGQENASREFRKAQIEEMVKRHQEKDRWEFVFLSSDLNAIDEARGLGHIEAKMLSFDHSSEGMLHAFHALSSRTRIYRDAVADAPYSFAPEDKAQATEKKAKRGKR